VASRGRHTRSNPHLPLVTPEADLEAVRRKGKRAAKEVSADEKGNTPSPSVRTPFSDSQFPSRPSSEVSRSLIFGSVPAESSPPGLVSEGEILVTPLSGGFTTPPLITTTPQRGPPAHSSPLDFSLFPPSSPVRTSFPSSPVHTPSPPSPPPFNIPMAGVNPPPNRMDAIVTARYAPLILPQPLNPLPAGDYLKYMPKFSGEGDVTAEEHLAAFYSYADNLNIENEDVWMRVFVQSLDGEVRKWFRGLAPGSIAGIEALDNVFLRQWGDRKDYIYYMTEFGSLKKQEGEFVSDFSKRFNKMYNKIPAALPPPRSKKEVQAFLGRINFLRRFVSNFAEMVKHITAMLRKGHEIKWTAEPRKSFDQIKKALTEAPVLVSPDYSKDFMIFSFASFDTVAAVLLQKNDQGKEQPIAFFSKALRDAELRYEIMERQAYALVKALKDFRVYVLHSKFIAYVPSTSVKDILIQPDIDGRRSKWIAKILEFDLEIKPTKLIKGQGLARLLAESNYKALEINLIHEQAESSDRGSQGIVPLAACPWYKDILYFLQELRPPDGMEKSKARALRLKAVRYCLIGQALYWRNLQGILLMCLDPQQA
jgi:hypothetical protein